MRATGVSQGQRGWVVGVWSGLDGEFALAVEQQRTALLNTYRSDPKRLGGDANTERSIHEGAYSQRRLFELMHPAADAMRGGDGGSAPRRTKDEDGCQA